MLKPTTTNNNNNKITSSETAIKLESLTEPLLRRRNQELHLQAQTFLMISSRVLLDHSICDFNSSDQISVSFWKLKWTLLTSDVHVYSLSCRHYDFINRAFNITQFHALEAWQNFNDILEKKEVFDESIISSKLLICHWVFTEVMDIITLFVR